MHHSGGRAGSIASSQMQSGWQELSKQRVARVGGDVHHTDDMQRP